MATTHHARRKLGEILNRCQHRARKEALTRYIVVQSRRSPESSHFGPAAGSVVNSSSCREARKPISESRARRVKRSSQRHGLPVWEGCRRRRRNRPAVTRMAAAPKVHSRICGGG